MTDTGLLEPGDLVPHFRVTTITGETFAYDTVWQRRNLVLVTLSGSDAEHRYASELAARGSAFDERESVCVVTSERVAGVPVQGVLVTDRWGEIVRIVSAPDVAALPTPQELLDCLEAIEHRCPECEGEWK